MDDLVARLFHGDDRDNNCDEPPPDGFSFGFDDEDDEDGSLQWTE